MIKLYQRELLFYILLIIECNLLKLVLSECINNLTKNKQNHGNEIIKNNIDINSIEIITDNVLKNKDENSIVYKSENIPIKFWKEDKKEELKDNFNNQLLNETVHTSTYSSINFSFYNQLSEKEKKIYNKIYTESNKSPPEVNINMTVIVKTHINKYIEKLSESAERVFTALAYENPELWWIGNYQILIYQTAVENKYNLLFLTLPEGSIFENYSPVTISEYSKRIENVKNEIMDQISNQTLTTDYAIMRFVHDYLIIKIQYILDESLDHIRTVYGALVDNICVCEGYAEAFQYIVSKYGINCIIARSSTHEWNFVQMNDKWYIVDVTYDDPIKKGINKPQGSADNLQTQYFLIGTNHKFKNGNRYSDESDHVLVYSAYSDLIIIDYPEIESSDYIPSELEIEELNLIDLSNIITGKKKIKEKRKKKKNYI